MLKHYGPANTSLCRFELRDLAENHVVCFLLASDYDSDQSENIKYFWPDFRTHCFCLSREETRLMCEFEFWTTWTSVSVILSRLVHDVQFFSVTIYKACGA